MCYLPLQENQTIVKKVPTSPTHSGWVGHWCRAERHQQGAVISQKEMLEQSCFCIRDQRGWISEKHQQQFRVFISLPLKSWQCVLIEKINLGLSHLVPGFIANEGKILELQCSDSVNYSLPDSCQTCIKKQPQIQQTTFVWNSISTLLFPLPTKIILVLCIYKIQQLVQNSKQTVTKAAVHCC